MFKNKTNIIFSLLLAVTMIASLSLSVFADSGQKSSSDDPRVDKLPKTIGEQIRTSANSVATLKNISKVNGKTRYSYEEEITLNPKTLNDLVTLIDASWNLETDGSGQNVYKSGVNLFNATVYNNYVSVMDSNGKLYTWNPKIFVGNKEFIASSPELIKDPLNSNYGTNTIKWSYGDVKNANVLSVLETLDNKAFLTRYLRIIEGVIMEYWILEADPGDDIKINFNDSKELNMKGKESLVTVCDSSIAFDQISIGRNIVISKTSIKGDSIYTIKREDFKSCVFPITIDPDVSFTSSSADAYAYGRSSVYNTAWTNATSYSSSDTNTHIYVDQAKGTTYYYIDRGYLYFDTSSIPSGATISQAQLALYLHEKYNDDSPFSVVLQTGGATYPHNPFVAADYNKTYYSGDGGSLSYDSSTIGNYNYIVFNSTGLGYITKAGASKFCLRTSDDINGTTPVGENSMIFYSYEMGSGFQPTLLVNYYITPTTPTVTTNAASNTSSTTVRLNGTLDNDGRSDPVTPTPCTVSFQYGTTTSYTLSTPNLSGYTTGNTFWYDVAGLSQGTTYHLRARATNSAGTGYGSDATFLTLPDEPTSVSVTPGNQENSVSWTAGTGSGRTMVRFKTTGYPTSVADGTQAYYSTGTSFTHTSLTGGTTYYYSFWGEKTDGSLQQYSSSYAYGNGAPFTLAAPTITTQDATAITTTTARMNGYISATNQTSSTVSLYFEYGTSSGSYGAPVAATPATINYNEYGPFYLDVTGLSDSTPYFFRVKAVGSGGTSYGAEKTFTTGGYSAPTMTTTTETNVGLLGFTMNGEVTDSGGQAVTASFQYGLTAAYGSTTPTVTGLTTGSTFTYVVNGLIPSTTYHYRAVGVNSTGTAYGADENVTTSAPGTPTVTTGVANNIGADSATLLGSITDSGGVSNSGRFQYGKQSDLSDNVSTGWQTSLTTGQTFSAAITGLDVATTYYYRAQAMNTSGTSNGEILSFETIFEAPSNFQVKAITSTSITSTWTKTGTQTMIVMKRTGYPIDRTDGDVIYFGEGTQTSYSGLVGGNTYFFRAWSWRTGDIWTDDYSEDAVTMPLYVQGEITAEEQYGRTSDTDTTLYQDPDTTKLSTNPIDAIISTSATDSGIPYKTLWFIVGLSLALLFAGFISNSFDNQWWIFFGAAALGIGVGVQMTIIPMAFLVLSLILISLAIWSFRRTFQ